MTMRATKLHHPELKVAVVCAFFALALALFFIGYSSYVAYYGYDVGFGVSGYGGKPLSHDGLSYKAATSALALGYSDAPADSYSATAPPVAEIMSTNHDAPALTTVATYTDAPRTTDKAPPLATYAAGPDAPYTTAPDEARGATYHAAPAAISVVRSTPVLAAAPPAPRAAAADVTSVTPFQASSAATGVVRAAPVVDADPDATYAAAPALTRVAIYQAAQAPTYAASTDPTYAAAPAVSYAAVPPVTALATGIFHHAQDVATFVHAVPVFTCYSVSHAAPGVASYGIGDQLYEYEVGTSGYDAGHCGLFFNQ